MRLSPSMKAWVSADWRAALRDWSRWRPSLPTISRLLRPVTSATASTPNRSMIASSAVAIGGRAQSCSIIRSRAANAERHRTGLPASSTIGSDRGLPFSSVNTCHQPDWEALGEIVDDIFSRGRDQSQAPRALRGSSSASRRSSMASAVETSWTTTALPSQAQHRSRAAGLAVSSTAAVGQRSAAWCPRTPTARADLAPLLSVSPLSSSTMRVASSASRRLAWMIAQASA